MMAQPAAPARKPKAKPNLGQWIKRVAEQEMPIFGRTVESVLSVAHNEDSTVSELARVVLQDSAMTARVLKLVNSSLYNPSSEPISTISRAILLLGFDNVRDLSLSVALIDSFVKGPQRSKLDEEMAQSIHAAVQARNIARERGDRSPEEVFIATLLYRIGQMAFWCFGGELADELLSAQQSAQGRPEECEKKVLGFTLKDLSWGLAREWRLSGLLKQSLQGTVSQTPRTRTIALSHELAEAARSGWKHEGVQRLVAEVADLLGQSKDATRVMLEDQAREATGIARDFGARDAIPYLPVPDKGVAEAEPNESAVEYPEPDAMLQLAVLREMKQLVRSRPTFNTVLEAVLEGIYRGVGMDRTLFALLTPDRQTLVGKFALGDNDGSLLRGFHFSMDRGHPSVLLYTMAKRADLWVTNSADDAHAALVTPALRDALGNGPFFVAPLIIDHKSIGLLYADGMASGRELDEQAFSSFTHFAAEANQGLSYIVGQRPSSAGR
jgi:HD-like signal output (HDOD) protein